MVIIKKDLLNNDLQLNEGIISLKNVEPVYWQKVDTT